MIHVNSKAWVAPHMHFQVAEVNDEQIIEREKNAVNNNSENSYKLRQTATFVR